MPVLPIRCTWTISKGTSGSSGASSLSIASGSRIVPDSP